MALTHNQIVDILDIKYIAASSTRFTLPPGIYEISDLTSRLKFLLPDDVKVNITIDDTRLRSNLTTNKTIKLTKKISFFIRYYVLLNHIQVFWMILQLNTFKQRQVHLKVKSPILLLEFIKFL